MVHKLVEECNETIDEEVEIIDNNKNKYNSCIALFSIFFIINVGIGAYFAYYKYVNRNKKMFLDIMFLKQQFIKHKNGKSQTN